MAEIPEPIHHTVLAVYDALAAKSKQSDSRGVPMGNVADECERKIWYALRWAAPHEVIDGQKQSRFDSGNAWEKRLLDELELIGVQIDRIDPSTGKQFFIELANGWLRGKMDAVGTGIPEAPQTLHVIECKSHSGKSFKELLKHQPPTGDGIKKSKPEHYAQCQSYCHAKGISRCLYWASDKDTEARYAERVEYDIAYALQLEAKVARVVRSDRAPSRLHDDPKSKAAFACGWCPGFALCHERAWARINCRTCLHASLEDGANLRCSRTGEIRTYPEQQVGCSSHRWLPSLVPAEQVDVQGENILYRLEDGSTWADEEGKHA